MFDWLLQPIIVNNLDQCNNETFFYCNWNASMHEVEWKSLFYLVYLVYSSILFKWLQIYVLTITVFTRESFKKKFKNCTRFLT